MSTAAVIDVASFSSALEAARQHHSHGHLLQAAQAYRHALLGDPRSQPALLGLSLIARQSNQQQAALKMAVAALAAGHASAFAWANYGDTLLANSQSPAVVAQAQAAFRHAIAIDRGIAAAHYGLGNTLAMQEDFRAALQSLQIAAELAPNLPEFHFALAFAHGKLGAHPQAIGAYRRAVTQRPGFASAWLNLGVELIADGRGDLAAPCYLQALAAAAQLGVAGRSTQISAHLNLGHLERSRRRFTQAQEHYEHALALSGHASTRTRQSEVHVAFAYLYIEQRQFPQAWQALRAAESAELDQGHESNEGNAEIPNARGILLLAEDTAALGTATPGFVPNPTLGLEEAPCLREAIGAFREAEVMGHKTAASNRGNTLLRLGRCEESLAAHQAALDLDPYHPGARYNLALTQLRLGDFTHGWSNYEIRWSFREVHPRPRRFSKPRWQGEPLPNESRLFLYAEQGLGDTLQFIRYLPLVIQRVQRLPAAHLSLSHSILAHLILEVQPALARLLTPHLGDLNSIPGISAVLVSHGDPLPPFTHHCPLMSLPALFQTTVETIPARIPYLHADAERTRVRARELQEASHLLEKLCKHPLKIGIGWAGNPNYRADHERSTRLQTFLPLLQLPNIHWISLQKGEAAQQLADLSIPLYDGCSRDHDLADAAALIANLDLVIATDSAIAHLTGALGKPLWLLLPWQSDWRWMQEISTSPWYPTARLFRQASAGDWPGLIERVSRELQLLLAQSQSSQHSIEAPSRTQP